MRNRPPGRLEELVRPPRCALLVIDMQRDFCDPALARRDISMTLEMMPRLIGLMDAARQASVPVIHIRTEHPESTDSDVFLQGPRWSGEPRTPLCRPGSIGAEFAPGFDPLEGETVVTKHRYSGFIGTNLALILRSMDIRTIVTAGVQTNNCVDATARDGMMLDHFLVFVGDATGTYDRALHDATLVTIAMHYGEVVSTDELIGAWGQAPAPSNS
ncbi:MAG: ureidoacrylate peracid hydrolase [Chloroflexota bacterium]|jgi:ureidoacrylate peracid hydrolase|nr:ureidoacrylate peracid hydrolase [Chloroflexota bacterium]